ncbi:MAG: response regulator transcription factor [Nonlabens sp.]
MNDCKPTITLSIVDDETLMVSLLSSFFDKQEEFNVIFKAESGEQLIQYLANAENAVPDILLLDINMKGMSGIDTIPQIKRLYPDLNVIVMSSHYKKNFTGFMLKTGVAAFLPKGISPFKLQEIILEVHEKGFYFMEEQLGVVRKQLSSRSPGPVLDKSQVLSDREIEVLELICQQKKAREIADQLSITHRTVEGHKKHLFAKTETKNIAGLVIFAIQNGLVDLDSMTLEP